MNLVDATVIEVTGEPFIQYGWWWVPVKYDCWGTVSEKKIMCGSETEAKAIKPGHQFMT